MKIELKTFKMRLKLFQNNKVGFFKKAFFFMIFILTFACCTHVPTKETPVQIKRSFNISYDQAWDKLIEHIKKSGGKIVAEDKNSKLIVYSIKDNKEQLDLYINAYIRKLKYSRKTMVYLIPFTRKGPYFGEFRSEIFEKLEQHLVDN